MLVTKIELQKRRPQRANVYIDDEFAFGAHVEVIAACGLKKGDEVEQSTIDAILAREEFSLANELAGRYLSYRSRSEKELREKLFEKEFDPPTIDAVVAHLRKLGYLDDAEFARAFIHDAQMRKPTGRRLLQHKLRLKGIAAPIIEDALEKTVSARKEHELALKEATKVLSRYTAARKSGDRLRQEQWLAQHLARRGFGWSTILPVIKEVFKTSRSFSPDRE